MSTFRSEYRDTAVTIFPIGSFPNLGSSKRLGAGIEATVYEADTVLYGKVAIKKFVHPFSPMDEKNVQEIATLVRLNCHPNIVRIFGLLAPENDFPHSGYVMEFMAKGSLYQVIHGEIPYNRQKIYSWILQASRGLAYLHNLDILHRDVKPQNMLLGGDTMDVLKISDFGTARLRATEDSLTTGIGTVAYIAPEVFTSSKYDSSCDVYSLAISAWEIFHRKKPYYQKSFGAYQLCLEVYNGARPEIEVDIEEEMKEAIWKSFHLEPSARPKLEHFIEISKKLGQISTPEPALPPRAPQKTQDWLDEERLILAKTIFGEARGECLKGQHAVGHVVLNRRKGNKSYWGGNTIIGVCLQKGQFACWDGKVDVTIRNDERNAFEKIYSWVPDLLEGKLKDPTDGCDYFNNPSLESDPGWVKQALLDGKRTVDIGNHRFYHIGY